MKPALAGIAKIVLLAREILNESRLILGTAIRATYRVDMKGSIVYAKTLEKIVGKADKLCVG